MLITGFLQIEPHFLWSPLLFFFLIFNFFIISLLIYVYIDIYFPRFAPSGLIYAVSFYFYRLVRKIVRNLELFYYYFFYPFSSSLIEGWNSPQIFIHYAL